LEKVFFAPGPKSFCNTFTQQANIYGRRKSGFAPIADMTQYYAAIILIACAFWLLHLWFD
jgi:hypothetical protein